LKRLAETDHSEEVRKAAEAAAKKLAEPAAASKREPANR